MSQQTDEMAQLAQDEAFLKAEMQKLADKRAMLMRQQEEQRRQEELNKEFTMTALRFVQGSVVVNNSDYRQDVVVAQQHIPTRHYIGNGENSFAAEQWPKLKQEMAKLPNVKILISVALEKEIYAWINSPAWEINLGIRSFECKLGPKGYTSQIQGVPGAEWKHERKLMLIPLTEGWRLHDKLNVLVEKDGLKVEWSSGAQKLILKQLEGRARLDEIAMMERGVLYKDFEMGPFKLRHFQEVGAEFIEAAGGRALLGYEMGLGKTIISLAYVVKNNLRAIVICPASLKANWTREIRKATGKAPLVLSGGEPTRYDMIRLLTDPPQVTLINYDILSRKSKSTTQTKDQEGYTHEKKEVRFLWADLLNLSKPDIYISDESHYTKNVEANRSEVMRQLKAPRFLMMTGTPVLNRPGELWPLLNVLHPDQFPAYETFLRQYTYDGKTARNVEELRQLLRSIMIRRTRKDVHKDLPPVDRITEYHDMGPKALKLYRKIESGIYEAIGDYSVTGKGGHEMGIANLLAMIQRLKMVCAIDKCEITAEQALNLYDQTDEGGYRKVLIFSQYKGVAYKLSQLLGSRCLSFVSKGRQDFVTAENEERDRLVQQFQNDPNVHFLVVTEKTAKEGHNITAAGHVIFNDLFWTPAGHDQAEGRAYGRESDSHGISAYYNISTIPGPEETTDESIEEWIWQLLKEKMAVINEVVEGVEGSRDVSVVNELIEKMRGKMSLNKRR
ncbi:MAG: DEAD/DEAH box helicase [Blastocatellia bacterium]|nr:DEAD/DEAH box helicase [Blastocatellia bacterium]